MSAKSEARELLAARDFESLIQWAEAVASPLRHLFSLTFDASEVIQWRAVEAIGRVAGVQAETDLEPVRDFVRRLLWLMNDESGGLGWHAPEAIGEILVNVPDLALGSMAFVGLAGLRTFLVVKPKRTDRPPG